MISYSISLSKIPKLIIGSNIEGGDFTQQLYGHGYAMNLPCMC